MANGIDVIDSKVPYILLMKIRDNLYALEASRDFMHL